MDEKRFDRPVRILLGRSGKVRSVTSTREAAECLLNRWPIEGLKHFQARLACMAVLEGIKEIRTARKAFEAAAAEADILVVGK